VSDFGDRPVIDPTRFPETPFRTFSVAMGADMRIIEGQLKVAHVRQFEFFCDEPPSLGGQDQYPQPLHYVAAGVGF
jgi:hypothetical protein